MRDENVSQVDFKHDIVRICPEYPIVTSQKHWSKFKHKIHLACYSKTSLKWMSHLEDVFDEVEEITELKWIKPVVRKQDS
jgi:hypothetical protein